MKLTFGLSCPGGWHWRRSRAKVERNRRVQAWRRKREPYSRWRRPGRLQLRTELPASPDNRCVLDWPRSAGLHWLAGRIDGEMESKKESMTNIYPSHFLPQMCIPIQSLLSRLDWASGDSIGITFYMGDSRRQWHGHFKLARAKAAAILGFGYITLADADCHSWTGIANFNPFGWYNHSWTQHSTAQTITQ